MIENSKQHYCTINILVDLNPFFVIFKEYIQINIGIPIGIIEDFWCHLFFSAKTQFVTSPGIPPVLKADNIGNLQEFFKNYDQNSYGFCTETQAVSACFQPMLQFLNRYFNISFSINRHEKDGVQDEAVAWKMLCLLYLSQSNWYQVLHTQGGFQLLDLIITEFKSHMTC